MLLAVNVENRKISIALFEENNAEPVSCFKISADISRTADEYTVIVKQLLVYSGIDLGDIDGTIMASVVPQLNDVIRNVVLNLTGKAPVVVGPGVKTGFAIKIDDPAELGADIVAGAAEVVGRIKEEKLEGTAIILDIGAVTTLFAIKNREVIGGAILPGAFMSLDALHRETAQLPNVEMSGIHRAIGKNTKESLISGVILGQAAMIDGLIDRFEVELGCESGKATVFATGEGADPILSNLGHSYRYDPALTLKGLARIYKNTAK